MPQGPLGTQITVSGSGCPTESPTSSRCASKARVTTCDSWDPAAPDASRSARRPRPTDRSGSCRGASDLPPARTRCRCSASPKAAATRGPGFRAVHRDRSGRSPTAPLPGRTGGNWTDLIRARRGAALVERCCTCTGSSRSRRFESTERHRPVLRRNPRRRKPRTLEHGCAADRRCSCWLELPACGCLPTGAAHRQIPRRRACHVSRRVVSVHRRCRAHRFRAWWSVCRAGSTKSRDLVNNDHCAPTASRSGERA